MVEEYLTPPSHAMHSVPFARTYAYVMSPHMDFLLAATAEFQILTCRPYYTGSDVLKCAPTKRCVHFSKHTTEMGRLASFVIEKAFTFEVTFISLDMSSPAQYGAKSCKAMWWPTPTKQFFSAPSSVTQIPPSFRTFADLVRLLVRNFGGEMELEKVANSGFNATTISALNEE